MPDDIPLSPDKPSAKLNEVIQNDSKNEDSSNTEGTLELANKILKQRLRHRTWTFYGVIVVCFFLYVSFGIFL